MNLKRRKAEWELLPIAMDDSPERPLNLNPKGCFVTFGMHELDTSLVNGEVGHAHFPKWQLTDQDGDEEMKT